MDAEEFRALVRRMRQAQRDYFKSRSIEKLRESKELERTVDAALNQTPGLFDRKD